MEIFEIKEIHLKLAQRYNLIWNETSGYSKCPMIYDKKPYGNEDYIKDILKICEFNNKDIAEKIHLEMKTVLEICFNRLGFQTGKYVFVNNKWLNQNEMFNLMK